MFTFFAFLVGAYAGMVGATAVFQFAPMFFAKSASILAAPYYIAKAAISHLIQG